MNKKHFDRLQEASADFVKTVDALVPDYEKGTEADAMYNGDLQAERRKSRNADTESKFLYIKLENGRNYAILDEEQN